MHVIMCNTIIIYKYYVIMKNITILRVVQKNPMLTQLAFVFLVQEERMILKFFWQMLKQDP